MCETFNAWILVARHKTDMTMLEEIRVKMMERIEKLREFADTWMCDISPIAIKVYQDNMAQSIRCTIKWNGEYCYEVEDTSLRVILKHCVNMQTHTCTCMSWMLKGIPCAHAIAAMHFKNIEPINYISHWYHKFTYLKAYSTFIQHVPNMQMWPTSINPPIEPPPIKKMSDRPKKKRKREETEHPKSGKLSRREKDVEKEAEEEEQLLLELQLQLLLPILLLAEEEELEEELVEVVEEELEVLGLDSFNQSGGGKLRVISHGGEKRSSADIHECAYKPTSGVK
uniref:SWIM-type domain-containing protein n=1 Tax=Nicotiana tabacum TaxID=4097 RepID=A0A1S3YE62_TOBAC|nr:PREDICTED: uncharacterized protein LOC107775285 [Nicotiana tabacum]